MPRLNSNSVEQLQEVLNHIKRNNIKEFPTQNKLHAVIEDIKFPHLINWKQTLARQYNKDYDTSKPLYANRNYTPIVNCLIKNGVVDKHKTHYRIMYSVNWEVLEKLVQFTNEY